MDNDEQLTSMKKDICNINTKLSEPRNKRNTRESVASSKSALSYKNDDIVEDDTHEKEISEEYYILPSKKLNNIEKLSSKKK